MEKICKNCKNFNKGNNGGLFFSPNTCKLTIKSVINDMPEGGWKQGDVMAYQQGTTVNENYSCNEYDGI